VVVGAGAEGQCAPATTCLGQGQTDGTGAEEVTVTTAAGDLLYVVVDGHEGDVAGYTLEVDCAREL
jgi:hypothetical protein